MDIIIAILYLLSFGAFSLNKWGKTNIAERPLLYTKSNVITFLNINASICLVLAVALLVFNWKLFIGTFLLGLVVGPLLIAPLVSFILAHIFR